MEPIATIIPHSDTGDPECCGCLVGLIEGNQANIVCNECGEVVAVVPAAALQAKLAELAVGQEVSSARCPYCGAVNTFPGFSFD